MSVKFAVFAIAALAIVAAAAIADAADVSTSRNRMPQLKPAAGGGGDLGDPAEIRFQNHRFAPQSLSVPAGQPLVVKVTNDSKETIEFESFKLNREVAMTPGETITVRLPALDPGSYDFYDDFHQDVPEGSIVAK